MPRKPAETMLERLNRYDRANLAAARLIVAAGPRRNPPSSLAMRWALLVLAKDRRARGEARR